MFVKEKKRISSYSGVKRAINNLTNRIETSRRATAPEERRRNVDTIKGIISPHFVAGDLSAEIYSNHSTSDIDASIRRSEIELSYYELKQGIVSLGAERAVNDEVIKKVLQTICGIANNGPNRAGKIILGVADSQLDAKRIAEVDRIEPRKVAEKYVVGINREAAALAVSLERYHALIRDAIARSELTEPLKGAVLSSIDFNSYYGLGVIVITIPPQREPSFLGDSMFWREGDQTKLADGPKLISAIGRRFVG